MKISGVITLLCVCGLTGTVINMENTGKEYDMRLEADARWNTLTEYCSHNPKQYYSIDVYSSTSYQGTPYADKIFAAFKDKLELIPLFNTIPDEELKQRIQKDFENIEKSDKPLIEKIEDAIIVSHHYSYDLPLAQKKRDK